MSKDKYKNKYRIPSNRLQGYDYGANGCYYVTICTKNRMYYFGEIVDGEMKLSSIGDIAEKFWIDIPNHFPFVILDEFVVMPNHIHGILFFNKTDEMQHDDVIRRSRDVINHVSTTMSKIGGITGNHCTMLHQNLGRVLRWFKGRVSFECHSFANFEWQERFHDRIIRDNTGLNNVRAYIFNNPQNWNHVSTCEKKLT